MADKESIGYTLGKWTGTSLIAFPLLLLMILWDSVAFYWLYRWFIEFKFNAPSLGYWEAAGIMLTFMALRGWVRPAVKWKRTEEESREDSMFSFKRSIIGPIMALVLGYAIKNWT